MVASLVEGMKLLQCSAVGLQELEVGLSGNEIQVLLKCLNRRMRQAELEERPGSDLKLRVDVGSVLSERRAQKPHRTNGSVGLISPSFSASVSRGWRVIVLSWESGISDSTKMITTRISRDALLDLLNGTSVFGNDASEELTSPQHDLKARLQTGMFGISKVLREDVAAALSVIANGLGNRNGETSKRPLGRGGHFASIEGSREDESFDDPPLCFVGPGFALKKVT